MVNLDNIEDSSKAQAALKLIDNYAINSEEVHLKWLLDQLVRCLTGGNKKSVLHSDFRGTYQIESYTKTPEYEKWLENFKYGDEGPNTYKWDEGVPP